jgi:hypothetical protein
VCPKPKERRLEIDGITVFIDKRTGSVFHKCPVCPDGHTLAPLSLRLINDDRRWTEAGIVAFSCCKHLYLADFATGTGSWSEAELDSFVEAVRHHWDAGGPNIGLYILQESGDEWIDEDIANLSTPDADTPSDSDEPPPGGQKT